MECLSLMYDPIIFQSPKNSNNYLLVSQIRKNGKYLYLERFEDTSEKMKKGVLTINRYRETKHKMVLDYSGLTLECFGTTLREQYLSLLEYQWSTFISIDNELKPYIRDFTSKPSASKKMMMEFYNRV